jgi:hypothetical protein
MIEWLIENEFFQLKWENCGGVTLLAVACRCVRFQGTVQNKAAPKMAQRP